ncbi:hypothetical protein ACNKHR_29125 [Shigella flexneri]
MLKTRLVKLFCWWRVPEKSESMVGPFTRQCIQQVHFSKAFIGIDGWQPETGFTGREMTRTMWSMPCWKKSAKR